MKNHYSFLVLAIMLFSIQVYSQQHDNAIEGNDQNTLSNSIIQPPYKQDRNFFTPQVRDAATITVLPNSNATSQNARAPQGGRRFIRTVYLITPAEMTASLYGSTPVNAIGWAYLGSLIPQPYSSTGSVKVYLQNTTNAIYSKTAGWTTSIIGMTLVADGKINLPGGAAAHNAFVNAGGPGTSAFSTVAGEGVYVAIEYRDSNGIVLPFQGDATISCNNLLANSAFTYQNQNRMDTVMAGSAFRAVTMFSDTPIPLIPPVDILQVVDTYTTGIMLSPCGPDPNEYLVDVLKLIPDTSQICLNIKVINRPPSPPTIKFDTTVYFYLSGAKDTLIRIKIPRHVYDKLDTCVATLMPAPGEEVTDNNQRGYGQNTSCTQYNYADPTIPLFGGVSGGNGSYFVARFENSCGSPLPIVQVDYPLFYPAAASTNQIYYVVIMPDSIGMPGIPSKVPIYTSPPILTPPTFGVIHNLSHFLPTPVDIPANSRVYVGLRQTTTNPLGIGYQFESPIRRGTFFFTSLGNWVDLAAVPFGNVFRIMIGIRTSLSLQVGMFLEGYYNGNTMLATDLVYLNVRKAFPPYEIVDSSAAILDYNGIANFKLKNVGQDTCYLYQVSQRNHISTYSQLKPCNLVNECNTMYDFRTSASQAYGDNMVFVPPLSPALNSGGGYATYGGDVNQEGNVDLTDLLAVFNASANFVTGYVVEDINGDLTVDLTDIVITYNNAQNFVHVIAP